MAAEKAFERGYPVNVSMDSFLSTAENMLRQRGTDREINEVAVKDANIPMTGAFRRDTLMPVLVDYMNFVIHPQSDLKFESALNDELTAGVAASMASEESREPKAEDVLKADEMVTSHLSSTPLFNTASEQGALGVTSSMRQVASTPLSVTLLMLDTALESAHTLSQRYQQSSLGLAEPDVLDLTPVCELLASMKVGEHMQELPEQLQAQLDRVMNGKDRFATVNDDLPDWDQVPEDSSPKPETGE